MRLMGLIYLAAELKKDHASVPFLENQKIEPNCKKFIMMAYFWAHGVSGATQVSMIDFGEKRSYNGITVLPHTKESFFTFRKNNNLILLLLLP